LYNISRESPLPALLDDGAKVISRTALTQLTGTTGPFFQFINFMDAHGPLQHVLGYDRDLHTAPNSWASSDYDKWKVVNSIENHEEYLERYRGLYAASIDYLDRKVSRFIKEVQKTTSQETTFVITADHGENLGFPEDNHLLDHTSSLTEALLHVPFLIVNPPCGYDPIESEYFSQLDLGKLITGMIGGETPDVFADRIPAEVVGKTAGVSPKDGKEKWWDRMVRCVYDGTTKYEWDSLDNEFQYELDSQRPCWQRQTSGGVMPNTEWFSGASMVSYNEQAVQDRDRKTVDKTVESRLDDLGYL
jgi:arylsulfatase A-like enzyme